MNSAGELAVDFVPAGRDATVIERTSVRSKASGTALTWRRQGLLLEPWSKVVEAALAAVRSLVHAPLLSYRTGSSRGDRMSAAVTYRVKHETLYKYSAEVVHAHHLLHLVPRAMAHQACSEQSIRIMPEPSGSHRCDRCVWQSVATPGVQPAAS